MQRSVGIYFYIKEKKEKMRKIPITIITGFLGVGKTTLMRSLLENTRGKKMAVLVNEFGEVGVDGALIAACCEAEGCSTSSDNIIELPNGCICCTVQEEFLPTMQRLLERKDDIDHILIETSGLAMPKPLVRAVHWPDLKPHITIDAVITVVDCVGVLTGQLCDRTLVEAQRDADDSLDHEHTIEDMFMDQLTSADLVLISKTDLASGPDQVQRVHDFIAQHTRPNTKILPMDQVGERMTLLLGLEAASEQYASPTPDHDHPHDHDHHHDDAIESMVKKWDSTPSIEQLVDTLRSVVAEHEVYRIKGFVHILGKPMRMVLQGVGDRFVHYFDKAWEADELRQTRLVFIGKKLDQIIL